MKAKEKYIALLKNQLEKLNSPAFDLASWKKATVMILGSLFGEKDPHTQAIESIEYEYSSWSLRDESGTKDPVKVTCKETLEAIINELELSDTIATVSSTGKSNLNFIWEAFENELTGAKTKELKKLLLEEKNPDLKNTGIDIILQELTDDTKRNILKQILMSEELKNWFEK